MIKPLLTLVLTLLLPLGTLAAAQADLLEQLRQSQTLLDRLEDSLRPTDYRLLEPLEQLADRLMALDQFDDADTALGRAVQLARITNGLYTPRQLPILRKRVENAANRGDWKAALEQMEHLLWLYQTKSPAIDGVLVDALMQLSKLHIRGVAEDTEAMQTSHFRQSAYINRLALRVAQTAWGEHDRRLSPLLYNLLKQYHLQAVAIGRGGRAGFELRSIHPDSGVLRERPEVLQSYYLTGLGILNQIMELYSRGVPQLEGLAMSNFYLADWQVLFTHKEEALATYSIAYNYLVEAEVDPGLINRYFNQPEVLPVTEFYASIEAGLQGRLDQSLLSAKVESAKGSEYLLFNEWTASFPDVSTPMGLTPTPDSESNFALFSYSLAGLSKVTRWHQGRFTAGISMVQMAELIDLFPPSSASERQLMKKLQLLRFRPKMIDGTPQSVNGTLKYMFASRRQR